MKEILQSLQNQKTLRGDGDEAVASLSFEKQPMKKPIMVPEVEASVLDALAQYQNRDKWRKWGLAELREQGSCVLLTGPPGCGKTIIAKWMAEKIKRGFKQLSVANIGGGEPGATEKGVVDFFEDCRKRRNATIFMDECDHLLLARDQVVGEGNTWMVGTTETIMMQMSSYSGLVIAATNFEQKLDSAMDQRFMSIIHVQRPDFERRVLLWKQKWPARFPLQPREAEVRALANHDLNGRQIETVIINAASRSIRKAIKPSLKLFHTFCSMEQEKHISHEKEK